MSKKFNQKSIKIIDWFLKTIGVYVHQKRMQLCKCYQFITVFPAVFAYFTIAFYVFKKIKQPHEAVIAAAYFGACSLMTATIVLFFLSKRKMFNLLQILDNDVYKYPDEKNITFATRGMLDEKNSFNILMVILSYVCFGFSLSIVSPLAGFLLTGVYEPRMHPAAYPWTEEGTVSFVVVNILQLTGSIGIFWVFYVIQVLMILLTIEFLKQYEKLGRALLTLKLRTEETANSMMGNSRNPTKNRYPRDEEKFRNKYDDVYGQNIRHCIRHHQQMWKLFHLFESWFSIFFSIELAISAITFALVFYNLLTAFNPDIFLTITGSTFNVLVNFFSRCFIGEVFAEMNKRIMNTIFHEINWWEESLQNRNLLLFFHMTCKRSFNLTGFSVFSASYFTFLYVLRMSYSYFNILRTSFNK